MSHVHSESYWFQLRVDGAVYHCTFVLTDDRLITVAAAGRRRSEMLGGVPPRALATTIALELVHERPTISQPGEIAPRNLHRSWLDGLFERARSAGAGRH
ncbi:hypothetical protein BJ123_14120 [Rhodopseudomonas thermotolerans]|uniref:Uncharacterized protein n=2 Tax=Rhodopseudomonas TaxID=1073 RepID=A0A336JV67_9BRAD|nr:MULTISPECIES: hypothetical protein [Rhodopseudomonas]RED22392.1 hypothetical protein BJ125_14120 [Rhodopseudomonas pentothenatexigens]REF88717.1 hypothetical protein BJ123_14120 [Rhodopseudomonas thermotolerans]SSW93530.1 hypothetical protein SAMN05892882_14120 [Rhodopseudomonas pentothenatexigens]